MRLYCQPSIPQGFSEYEFPLEELEPLRKKTEHRATTVGSHCSPLSARHEGGICLTLRCASRDAMGRGQPAGCATFRP
jgi:hypothetical protein